MRYKIVFFISIIMSSIVFISSSTYGLNMELNIEDNIGIERVDEFVSSGIPIPKGILQNINNLTIKDGQGITIPAQFTTLARWADGSVKWVLCEFQANVSKNRKVTYYLTDTGGNPTVSSLKVTEDNNFIIVNTGPLRFTINKKSFNLFDSVWLDKNNNKFFSQDELIIAPNSTNGIIITDGNETIKYYSAADTPSEVVIEDVGPLRATIKVKGWHKGINNTKLLEYTTRIYAYANKSYIRVVHTLRNANINGPFNNGSLTYTYVNDISIKTNLNLKDGTPTYYIEKFSGTFRDRDEVYLFQDESPIGLYVSSNGRKVNNIGYKVKDNNGISIGEGDSALGLVDIYSSKADWGLTVNMRHFSQKFPKAIKIDKMGNVIVYLLPPYQMSDSSLDKTNRYIPYFTHNRNEILYYFHSGDHIQASSKNIVLSFNQRLLATLNPKEYVDSNALGKFATLEDERKVVKNWGWRTPPLPDPYDIPNLSYARADPRYYHSVTEEDRTYNLLLQFIKSGDRRYFNAGEGFALMDLHSITYSDNYSAANLPKPPGDYFRVQKPPVNLPYFDLMTYSHHYTAGIVLYYLLTGDKGILEAGEEHGEYIINLINYMNGRKGYARNVYWGYSNMRQSGRDLWGMSSLYGVTHKEIYKEKVKWCIETVLHDHYDPVESPYYTDKDRKGYVDKDIGWWRYPGDTEIKPFMLGIVINGLCESYNIVEENEDLKDILIGLARWIITKMWNPTAKGYPYIYKYEEPTQQPSSTSGSECWYLSNGIVFAYQHTGDTNYLNIATENMKADKGGGGMGWKGYTIAHYKNLMYELAYPKTDTTPPSKITDLEVKKESSNSVILSWSEPGDDNNVGKAYKYQIKYANLPIVEELKYPEERGTKINWWAAKNINNEPSPKTAGYKQNVIISGLDLNKKWYFAIKTSDEQSNWSEISNVATLKKKIEITPKIPTITVGTTQQFHAQAYDENNNPIKNLTYQWNIIGNIGTLSSTIGNTITFFASTLPMLGSITVEADGISTYLNINLIPAAITTIKILPNISTITVGHTQRFYANAYDIYNNLIEDLTYQWGVIGDVGTLSSNIGSSVTFFASTYYPRYGSITVKVDNIKAYLNIETVYGISPINIRINPATTSTYINQKINIDIIMDNVVDLLGVRIRVLFDKDKIKGMQVEEGELLSQSAMSTFFVDDIQNSNGYIDVYIIRLGTSSVSTDSGRLCSIKFKSITQTQSSLITISSDNISLRNSQNENIPFTITPGVIRSAGIIGDYDYDNDLDFEDLMVFALAWRSQDLTKEIGPATGTPPNMTIIPDGKIDFEDLVTMSKMWNWHYSSKIEKSGFIVGPALQPKIYFFPSELKLRQNQIVNLKINAENINALAMKIDLWFDPAKIEILNIESGNLLTNKKEGYLFFMKDVREGEFVATLFKSQSVGIYGDGELAVLKIKAIAQNCDTIIEFSSSSTIRDVQGNEIKSVKMIPVYITTGEDNNIKCYPNPAIKGESITFEGIPSNSIIRIFNICGELVKEVRIEQTTDWKWNLTNNSQEKVSSGIYIYTIMDNNKVIKKGKVGVIR